MALDRLTRGSAFSPISVLLCITAVLLTTDYVGAMPVTILSRCEKGLSEDFSSADLYSMSTNTQMAIERISAREQIHTVHYKVLQSLCSSGLAIFLHPNNPYNICSPITVYLIVHAVI